jgi:hypothetical protein
MTRKATRSKRKIEYVAKLDGVIFEKRRASRKSESVHIYRRATKPCFFCPPHPGAGTKKSFFRCTLLQDGCVGSPCWGHIVATDASLLNRCPSKA